MSTAPFGSWESPITAAHVAAGSEPIQRARFVGDAVWYSRRLSSEEGRTGIFVSRTGRFDDDALVLPCGYNARSRVHEYGGGAWEIDPGSGMLYFVNATDQRIHGLDTRDPDARPVPLTPASRSAVRYGDLVHTGGRLLAVRESHRDPGRVQRSIVAPVEDGGPVTLAQGPHFLAWPRISPDGRFLSFIGWDHPHMPWDETRVYVQELTEGRPVGPAVAIFGRSEESVLQPEWLGSTTLVVSADRTGWWELYRLDVPAFLARSRGEAGVGPAEEVSLLRTDGEIGGPLWSLGDRWHLPVERGNRILAESRYGTSSLVWADVHTGEHRLLDCGLTSFSIQDYRAGTALLIGGSAQRVNGLYTFDLASRELLPVALSNSRLAHVDHYPNAELREFDGIPAVVYPPRSPRFSGPAGEAPPYVAFVHGGPTGQAVPMVSAHHAYFTSRGIGVVDVNYGGSTGYGRAYRDRLRGQWGIVDVADTVTVLRGLAAAGEADADRFAISGGSAGGWTVLNALTTTSDFACGTSYYGVAELTRFVTETHDFESHYIGTLVGPLPESAAIYEERAPLNRLDALSAPVAVFHGELDPVVPQSQTDRLVAALERLDLPYVAKIYPRESHGFVRTETLIDSLETELGFYGRIMGFDTPGIRRVILRGRGR